jgi:CheY-specific phosphatase CheX
MLKSIEEATMNFCTHQLRQECTLQDTPIDGEMLIAYIDVQANAKTNHRVFLLSDKSVIQKVAQLFLEEDQSDEETLQDMLLETANLIIGSAKVIAQEKNESFEIETPHFVKYGVFGEDVDVSKTFLVEDGKFVLALKEIYA